MVTVKKNFIHQLYIYIFIKIKFICDIIQLLRMHYLLFDRMYIYILYTFWPSLARVWWKWWESVRIWGPIQGFSKNPDLENTVLNICTYRQGTCTLYNFIWTNSLFDLTQVRPESLLLMCTNLILAVIFTCDIFLHCIYNIFLPYTHIFQDLIQIIL